MDHINNQLPTCSVLIEDFNARCSKWCNNYITNASGYAIDTLISSAGYKQIINQPAHAVNDSFPSISLKLCNNLNIISNYGVDLSVYEKCHHNIIFRKINIYIPLPASYVREVGDYKKVNVKSMQKATETFDWPKTFGIFLLMGKLTI